MNKDFEKYIGKRVWCKSEYFAEAFLRLAHDNGWKWVTEESLLDKTYWNNYRENTCYRVWEDKKITFDTTRQRTPYYINEFIEYEPLCAGNDISLEEPKETLVKYYKVTVENEMLKKEEQTKGLKEIEND